MKKMTNDFKTRPHLEPELIPSNGNTSGWGRNAKLSYCESMQKNKPQSNSVSGGLLVLGAGGFYIAWLLWNLSKVQYTTTTLFIQLSGWYFGNIVGSIVGAVIVTKWQKRNVYYLCGTITIVGGIISIVSGYFTWSFAMARIISGSAHGIAYLATITHGAENVIKEMRGRLISSIQFMIYSFVFTFSIVMLFTYPFSGEDVVTEQMLGMLAIVFSVMGLLFTPCLTYESVTYLLYRNDDRQAFENMMKLRNESIVTWNISNDLQEMKLMVTEDRVRSSNITKDSNMRPLLLMMAISCIVALSNNLILNTNLIEITQTSFMADWDPIDPDHPNVTSIAAVILVTFRYISGLVMILSGDSFSRKKFLRLSVGLSAASLLIAHILSAYTLQYTNGVNWMPGVFAVAFQIFVGAGVEPMQHVLMSEAFSTAKKYWSIACIVTTNSLLQIAIIALSFIDNGTFVTVFVYSSIGIIALMTVIVHLKLPETRGISLRQALDAFTKTGLPEGITYS